MVIRDWFGVPFVTQRWVVDVALGRRYPAPGSKYPALGSVYPALGSVYPALGSGPQYVFFPGRRCHIQLTGFRAGPAAGPQPAEPTGPPLDPGAISLAFPSNQILTLR